MNNNLNDKQPFKIPISSMNAIALLIVILDVIHERFGTFPHYAGGRYSQMELLGICIPLMILIIPIFVKKYREECWNIKTLIISFGILIISIILISIIYANKSYYRILWIEEGHWTRDSCPPIHWDFWNIIGKSATG